MTAQGVVEMVEAAGGVLALNGNRIRYRLPEDATSLIDVLREHRDEVIHFLQDRKRIQDPVMPKGVKLVAWRPKKPPVAITSFSVVTDVWLFVRTTLAQLEASLQGKRWQAGNWSTRDLLQRLEQVGCFVEVCK